MIFQVEYEKETSKLMYLEADDMASAFRKAEEFRKAGKVKYEEDPSDTGHTCIIGTVHYPVHGGEWIDEIHD